MTLPSSGPLSLQDINTEFGRGTNLNVYRGTAYYIPSSGATFYFPTGTISISNFYGTQINSPVTPGSVTYTSPGTYYLTIPIYGTLTVELWGGGGSGVSNSSSGGTGGASYISSLGMTANGGIGGAQLGGGAQQGGPGGSASGGNSNNISGGDGGNGVPGGRGSQHGGAGGNGANGGAGGSGGLYYVYPATNGSFPGGGSGGSPRTAGGGGGGGAYCSSVFTGSTYAGSVFTIIVGAGSNNGADGDGSYIGANGQCVITWY